MRDSASSNDYLTNVMVDELVRRVTRKLILAMIGLSVIQISAMALLIRL